MAEQLGKRKAETALWEQHKPLLEYLFMTQNRTMKEVRDIMARGPGFNRSLSQYERRFKLWEFHKNHSAGEWRATFSALERRRLQGKFSAIINGTMPIPLEKATRRARRHAYETTYEKYTRVRSKLVGNHDLLSSTPQNIIVRSPSPDNWISNQEKEDLLSNTLWFSCLSLIDLTFDDSIRTQLTRWTQGQSGILSLDASDTRSSHHSGAYKGLMKFVARRSDLRQIIRDSPCSFIMDADRTIALRTGEAFMDLLRVGIYMISNNLGRKTGVGELIVSLCQLPTNRHALKRLLSQKHPSIEAFAEGLVGYATMADDDELVMILIRSGVDPNSIFYFGSSPGTLLRGAINCSASKTALALLKEVTNTKNLSDEYYVLCLIACFERNLLSVAVELLKRGFHTTLEVHFDFRVQNALSCAALRGGLPAVKLLAEHDPISFTKMIHVGTFSAFMDAASVGNEAVVRYFLGFDSSIDKCVSALCSAASNGKIEIVKLLTSLGVDLNGLVRDRDGSITPLGAAVSTGETATANFLLERGADPRIGVASLNKLCEKMRWRSVAGDMKLVKHIIAAGTQPNDKTLVLLSFGGYVDLVRELIGKGACLDATAYLDATSPHHRFWRYKSMMNTQELSTLTAALLSENDELISFLFDAGANVNLLRWTDRCPSPLTLAILIGRLDWAKKFLSRGVDPRDPAALSAAAYNNDIEAYYLIHDACLKLKGCSVAKFSLLACVEAIERNNLDFLRIMLKDGFQLNHPSGTPYVFNLRLSGVTPLEFAVRESMIDAVTLLLAHGADPNQLHLRRKARLTPPSALTYLRSASSSDLCCLIASKLIDAGARIDFEGPIDDVESPFAHAVTLGSVSLLDLLIQRGANINAVSFGYGWVTAPLYNAVRSGKYSIVRKLLDVGAIVFGSMYMFWDLGPIREESAIQLACSLGYLDILKILLEAGDRETGFLLEYPNALRLAYRNGHRALARYLQSYRSEKFAHMSCYTDDEILVDVDDKKIDSKFFINSWENERYNVWRKFAPHDFAGNYWDFIYGPDDNDESTGRDETTLNKYDNSDSINNTHDMSSEEVHPCNVTNNSMLGENDDHRDILFDLSAVPTGQDLEIYAIRGEDDLFSSQNFAAEDYLSFPDRVGFAYDENFVLEGFEEPALTHFTFHTNQMDASDHMMTVNAFEATSITTDGFDHSCTDTGLNETLCVGEMLDGDILNSDWGLDLWAQSS